MLCWGELGHRSRRVVCSLIGITLAEFEQLHSVFFATITTQKAPTWSKVDPSERRRKSGAGPKPRHDTQHMLFFILLYFRIYPTQDVLGFLFGGSQSWACRWVHRLTPILNESLAKLGKLPLPPKADRISTIEELLRQYPDLAFIIDATERPTRRPKNEIDQKEKYSGKKKRHTIKNTIVSDVRTSRICIIGKTFGGSVHDKKMLDDDPIVFPEKSVLYQDTGYQGSHSPGVSEIRQPRKKERNKERTEEDKILNRGISHIRVRVEHAICGLKRSHIVSDIYRNRKSGFDNLTMHTAGGLHNFRTDMRSSAF